MANEFTLNVPQSNIGPYLMSVAESLGTGLERFQLAQQQRQQQALDEQRRKEFQQQFQRDMIAHSKDGSAESLAALLSRYPSMKEPIMTVYKAANEEQRNNELADLLPAFSAWDNLDPETTYDIVNRRREAAKNSGDQTQFNRYDKIAKAIESNSDAATGLLQWRIAELVGPDKVVETISGIQTMRSRTRQAEAEAIQKEAEAIQKQAAAAVAAAKLALDMDYDAASAAKLRADMANDSRRLDIEEAKLLLQADKEFNSSGVTDLYSDLTGPLKESIKKDYVDAGVKRQSAFKMQDLADKIEARGGAGFKGAAGFIAEYFKEAAGEEDIDTYLKKQYSFDRSSAAMAALRGTGSVSNFELDTVLSGWPGVNANNELKIAWLRGTAKLANMEADVDAARGKWASMNKGVLGPSGKPMVVSGIVVPPSVDFDEFLTEYLYPSLQAKYFPDQEAQRDLEDGFIEEGPSSAEEGMSMMPGGQ